jgi:hypothetical protein
VHSVPTTLSPVVETLGTVFGFDIDWNGNGTTADLNAAADTNKLSAAGCTGGGALLAGFDDWQNLVFNARASIEFAGGVRTSDPEDQDKTADQELASFQAADYDADNVPDAFACSASVLPAPVSCAIDIKPGTQPEVISRGSTANIAVAILATADFDPVGQILRETLTLNEVGVKINNQGKGTCNAVASNHGRFDLVCQFPVAALPLGTNYSILHGLAVVNGVPTAIRARDAVTVVK